MAMTVREALGSWLPTALMVGLLAAATQGDGGESFTPVSGEAVVTSGAQKVRISQLKGFARPWAMVFLPNGDMLVTERSGRLRIVRNGVLSPEPISGIPSVRTTSLKGLMDIAIHPHFAENGFIYFTYSKPMPGETEAATATLARARFDGSNSLKDVRDIFQADAWCDGAQAARIVFGPRDGKIYMSVGMPTRHRIGNADDAQNPANHAGKILRLNDDGTAPNDNPFVGRPGYRPEIYALGIRNAMGLYFHPTTGELWETENGPQGGDELNIIKPGHNYGWPTVSYGIDYSGEPVHSGPWNGPGGLSGPNTADQVAPGMDRPIAVWVPSPAIAGLLLYNGDKFPAWKGTSIFIAALRGQQLIRIVLNNRGLETRRESLLVDLKQRIRDVKVGPDGLLYLTTDEDAGSILRLEPAASDK
jgi:glucose/arabinose dehydrogenase